MTDNDDLFSWASQPKRYTSYLMPIMVRRRRCMVFVLNPDWNGVLKTRAVARDNDPSESSDAAESVKSIDIHEVKRHVDAILKNGNGIISTEVREYVYAGIVAGTIDGCGELPDIRAESMRRRFHDLCP